MQRPKLSQHSPGNCCEHSWKSYSPHVEHHTCHDQLSPKRANLGMVFVWPACSILLVVNNYLLWILCSFLDICILDFIRNDYYIIYCPTSCISLQDCNQLHCTQPSQIIEDIAFPFESNILHLQHNLQLRGGNLSIFNFTHENHFSIRQP